MRYLASGGFGCTYEGVHTGLDKRVAIKEFFVKDICNRDENTAQISVGVTSKAALFNKLRKKFVDEARALCKLDHPNIVKVSDVFDENGTSYFVMDYIDGQSLKDMVYSQGPLPESVAVNYVLQIAEALGCVHDNNRLHLDVKPGNIMINSKGQAQLIDFGASKQYEEESGENTSSVAGYTIGYAPTEQMGNDIRRFTPATDVYSLGATLYNLLSGIKPISAAIISSGEQQQPLPPYVSASTRKAVEKAMQLNKTLRPQSMAEFASMLGAVDVVPEENGDTTVRAGQEPVEVEVVVETEKKAPAVVEKPTYKEPEESKSYGKILGVLGVIVVLAFIVAYFALPKSNGPDEPTAQVGVEAQDEVAEESVSGKEQVTDQVFHDFDGEEYTYTGEVVDGKPNGKGSGVYSYGNYTGEYKNGFRHGNGTYELKDGSNKFEGSFYRDNYNRGKLTMTEDGSYFEGTFKDGQPYKGKWYDKDGRFISDVVTEIK